jgi:hypothetical protein
VSGYAASAERRDAHGNVCVGVSKGQPGKTVHNLENYVRNVCLCVCVCVCGSELN